MQKVYPWHAWLHHATASMHYFKEWCFISDTGMARFITVFIVVSNAALFGGMMCSQLYPLYLQQVSGLELDHGSAVYVGLKPPSTNASCILLCSLTPGCLWAKFDGNGTCIISEVPCPRMAASQESTVVGIVSSEVTVSLFFIPHFTRHVITNQCRDWHSTMLIKGAYGVEPQQNTGERDPGPLFTKR